MKIFKLIFLLLLWSGFSSVSAQEAVVWQTNSGYISFGWWNGGFYADCIADGQTIPDCTLSKSVSNVWLSGNGSIKPFSIEADIRDAGNYSGRSFSGRSYYAMNIFAKVQPKTQVHLKINTSMFTEWNNCIGNELNGYSNLYLRGETEPLMSCPFITILPSGSNTCNNEIVERDVQACEEYNIIDGENYCFLGTLDLAGRVGMKALIAGANASYNASVNNIDARYKGKVLKLDNGNNQTYIVNQKLPKDLSVKVTEGETGAAVEGVDITFEILEPVNGAILSHQVVKTTDTGIAKTELTLGSSSGTYKVKATCPADVCTSGVNEVIFTETAVTNEQATELNPYFCDSTEFTGNLVLDGIRVQAINRITSEPQENMTVKFSLLNNPGGEGISLSPEAPNSTYTDKENGIARANLILSSLPGRYVVQAICQNCEANQEVLCTVDAIKYPERYNIAPSVSPVKLNEDSVNFLTLSTAEVTPQQTSGNHSVTININGSPNTQYNISVSAIANTGGHQHSITGRPIGTVSPTTIQTDVNGYANIVYTASEIGGMELITVQRTDSALDLITNVITVSVSPHLERLLPSSDYVYSGMTQTHPANHYGSQTLLQEIPQLAQIFKSSTTLSGGGILSINDMSLINGGLFDHKANWSTPHSCHRIGTSMDLDRKSMLRSESGRLYASRIKNMARKINTLLQDNSQINCRIVFEPNTNGKCMVHLECPTTTNCTSNYTDCEE